MGYYGCSWGENSYEYLAYSQVASAIGLTAGKIIKGNTILGIAGTGQAGVDTGDANATASDIRKSKTAYVNGSKVTGTMPELKDYYKPSNETIGITTRTSYVDSSGASHSVSSTKYLYIRMGSAGYVTSSSNDVLVPASKLGDATASNVLKGKTFTSINGVKLTGAMEIPSEKIVSGKFVGGTYGKFVFDAINLHSKLTDTISCTKLVNQTTFIPCTTPTTGYMGATYYTNDKDYVEFNLSANSFDWASKLYLEIALHVDVYNSGLSRWGKIITLVSLPTEGGITKRFYHTPHILRVKFVTGTGDNNDGSCSTRDFGFVITDNGKFRIYFQNLPGHTLLGREITIGRPDSGLGSATLVIFSVP